MLSKKDDSMDFLYKNPFDDYNANVLDPELIMQYWFTPFNNDALKGFNENRFYTQKMPIVLQGSRGSGKTTILKYFSLPVQIERAHRNETTLKEQIIKEGGVGFYFRCDDSFLKDFKSVYNLALEEKWVACFEHYFELFFVKNIIELINSLSKEETVDVGKILLDASVHEVSADLVFSSLDDFSQYITKEMRYINSYKNEVMFKDLSFSPQNLFSLYDISERLINAISKNIPELSDVLYLLLIDEYENLPKELQKMFNTLIKFCRPGISMRIGRRSENENIITKETVNNIEYLREEHDYSLIILDQGDIKSLRTYLIGIAQRRLEAYQEFFHISDIIKLLGDKEDLDRESREKVDERKQHIKLVLSGSSRLCSDALLTEKIISIISYPDNPIAEMLNALWITRWDDNADLLEAAILTRDAMNAFFNKEEHPLRKKYQEDYTNKYRYALTVLLCVAYKKDKDYYGFNDLCYLSEGNTRTFINLCKAIINDALFYEKKSFLDTKTISVISQTRAIRNFSINEFNSVCSIIQNGKEIREFILALGNIFSEFHKDKYVRYPEMNQFVFNYDELPEHAQDVISIAESWALIKKRKVPQRLSAGIAREGDIYTVNHIFSPLFNISYRIRGGVNVGLSSEEVVEMISGKYKGNKLTDSTRKKRSNSAYKVNTDIPETSQYSLFEQG